MNKQKMKKIKTSTLLKRFEDSDCSRPVVLSDQTRLEILAIIGPIYLDLKL